jgi:alpha-ribazole phosphatase
MVQLSGEVARLEFIRHGVPQGGVRYRGSGVDDALSEKGWQQMWDSMGEDHDWNVVLTSPLLRCREFAEAFALKHDLPCEVIEGLTEIRFGAWEGKTKAELNAIDPDTVNRFYADPVTHKPQGAEPVAQFRERIAAQFERLLADYAGQRVLVVCHAGVMRAVISLLLQSPLETLYRMHISNAMRMTVVGGTPPTVYF